MFTCTSAHFTAHLPTSTPTYTNLCTRLHALRHTHLYTHKLNPPHTHVNKHTRKEQGRYIVIFGGLSSHVRLGLFIHNLHTDPLNESILLFIQTKRKGLVPQGGAERQLEPHREWALLDRGCREHR